MKVKISELTDKALDYAVALAKGVECDEHSEPIWFDADGPEAPRVAYSPSTNWSHGGPIIERETAKIFRNVGGTWTAMILKDVPIPPEDRGTSLALTHRVQWSAAGPTPLIAAMRCYIASKLGEEIDIPE